MKKFLSMLTLVLALCLLCGIASAAVDYSKHTYFLQNGNVYIMFPGVNGAQPEVYPVSLDPYYYKDLATLSYSDVTVEKPADCTDDAVVKLVPNCATTGVRTTLNATGLTGFGQCSSPAEINNPTYRFFGWNTEIANLLVKTLNVDELAAVNPSLVSNSGLKAHGHSFTTTTTKQEATCEREGLIIGTCGICKKKDIEIVLEKTQHKPANFSMAELKKYNTVTVTIQGGAKVTYTLVKEETCATKGSYVGYCVNCKRNDVYFEIAAGGKHSYNKSNVIWTTPSTCLIPGEGTVLCNLCHKYVIHKEDKPLGHSWKFYNGKNEVAYADADCQGVKITDIECTRCGVAYTYDQSGYFGDQAIKVVQKSTWYNDQDGNLLTAAGVWNNANGNGLVLKNNKNHKRAATKYDPATYKAPTCEATGVENYPCYYCNAPTETNKIGWAKTVIVPALGHAYVTEIQKYENGSWTKVNAAVCNKDNAAQTYRSVYYCKNEIVWNGATFLYNGSPATAAQLAKYVTIANVETPAHKFTPWTVVIAPTTTSVGHWTRSCTVCSKVENHVGYDAPIAGNYTGLVEDADGKLYYYENGEKAKYTGMVGDIYVKDGVADGTVTGLISTANGFVYVAANKVNNSFFGMTDYNGGKFLIQNATILTSANGLVNVNGEWLFFANGQLQVVSQITEYDGYWFIIKDGKLDLSANGLYDYMGSKFLFAAGQLQRDYSGLWQDTANGKWYYLSLGQVQTQYTGIVEYDGNYFYVVNGELASGKGGIYTYVGAEFEVDDNGNAYPVVK